LFQGLKQNCDEALSNCAFKLNLRCYSQVFSPATGLDWLDIPYPDFTFNYPSKVGRNRLTTSKPALKAPVVSALAAIT
jgi:hypothetical protein